jgi:hypothetical protein
MQPVEHNVGDYISKAFEIYTKDLVNWIIIGIVGSFALGVGFWGGFHVCADKALRGEKPEVGDVLSPFSKFGEFIVPLAIMFGCSLLALCLVGIIGLVYFQIIWAFAYPLVMLRGMSWKEAAETSGAIAKQAMVPTFILLFVAGFIGGIGGIVGLNFITAPLTGIIMMLAFNKQFGVEGGGSAQLPPAQGGGWGTPAAPPAGAPPAAAPAQSWGPPAGAAPAAPAPAAPSSWAPPAPAPTPAAPAAPASPAAPAEGVESGTQSTSDNPDDAYAGKTMAMSAVDFEKMLDDRNKNNS